MLHLAAVADTTTALGSSPTGTGRPGTFVATLTGSAVLESWPTAHTVLPSGDSEGGLAKVRAQLYAVDCQTCGRPLGTDAPALVVNAMGEWAMAGLHHRGCRAAEWNDGAVIESSAGDTITWSAESALFPVPTAASGERASCAVLIVNPSLEVLFPVPGDRWLASGLSRLLQQCWAGAVFGPGAHPARTHRSGSDCPDRRR